MNYRKIWCQFYIGHEHAVWELQEQEINESIPSQDVLPDQDIWLIDLEGALETIYHRFIE